MKRDRNYWFYANIISLGYSKLERFFNIADEISTKLLSSFFECEMLVVIPNQYDFEFSIKAAKGKHRKKTQLIYRKLALLITALPWKFEQYNQPSEVSFPKMERNIVKCFKLLSNHLFGKFWLCNWSCNKMQYGSKLVQIRDIFLYSY